MFVHYHVDADYKFPTAELIGYGSICDTLEEAEQRRDEYLSRPDTASVTIKKVAYGF